MDQEANAVVSGGGLVGPEDDEDFPFASVGIGNPDFVLHGVAAGRGLFGEGLQPGGAEAGIGCVDFGDGFDLNAEVRGAPFDDHRLPGFIEREIQRRIGRLELDVARPLFGRRHAQ